MITLWKRHSATCAKKLKLTLKPTEIREFRKCNCACWITGVHPLTKRYMKQALGTTNWQTANELLRKIEVAPNGTVADESIAIADAFTVWLKDKHRIGTASTTLRGYEAMRDRVIAYAENAGLTKLQQLTPDHVYQMATSWEGTASTCAGRITKLREFYKFAIKRGWCEKNPALAIESPKIRHESVEPYTEEEQDRITNTLENWPQKIQAKRGIWSLRPTTFACLIEVLRDTGLRISDAVRVRPEMMEDTVSRQGFQITMSQMKSGRIVTVYLRPETAERLRRVPRISNKYPFMEECRNEDDRDLFKEHVSHQAQSVYLVLQMIGKLAGVQDCRPHRFRHSFAVGRLLVGLQLEDVQRLLGHGSILMTEKYYAKWVKARQQRLEEKVMRTWEEEGKVIVLRKRIA